MAFLTPTVPDNCMICGASYMGGHAKPGEYMKMGLRVFYECGASISIFPDCSHPEDGCFHLLVKNCWCEHNQQVKYECDGSRNGECQ